MHLIDFIMLAYGTKIGAQKSRDDKLKKDPDYYAKMGSLGGKSHNRGGFASQNIGKDGLTGPERASKLWKGKKRKADI